MKRIFIFLLLAIISFSCKKADKDFLSLNEEAFTTAISGLYVREKPSTTATIIGLLKYNTKLFIIGYSENVDTINGIKAPWAKIKVKNDSYNQTIEGWVFGGFISKTESKKNIELINDEKYDLSSIIKLLDETCRLQLVPGPIGYLYFKGDRVVRENNFIQIDVPMGGEESHIEKIEYKKDSLNIKIKHDTYDEDSIDSKISKTEFFKCIISKQIIIDIYNKKLKDPEVKCELLK